MSTPSKPPQSSSSNTAQVSPNMLLFARGVVARLKFWPTLRLAVESGWGGSDSASKGTWMAGVLVDAFDPEEREGSDEPDVDYIEEMLLQIMEDEFQVNVEDGSARAVAGDIVRLWSNLGVGGESEKVVREWEARVVQTAGKKIEARFEDQSHEEEGDDDDDNDWEDEDEGGKGEGGDGDEAPMLVDRGVPAPSRKPEPEVDDDGFTMVKGKGKTHH